MDNNKEQLNIDTTINFIQKTYDNLTYLDLYGNSVIIFIFMTLFVFIVYSYCKVIVNKEAIASDWSNQRCKPQNMVVAGFITHPEGKTALQYTSENFQYCVSNILNNIVGYSLEPFQYMVSALNTIFSDLTDALQKIREVFNTLRNGISDFASDVLSRILNIMMPLQKIVIVLI